MSRVARRVAAVLAGAAAITGTASGASSAGSAGSNAPYSGALTFDWPTGCAITVEQTYYGDEVAAEGTFEMTVERAPAADENLVVDFGPIDIDVDVTFGDLVQPDEVAAFFTNPVVEIELDGSPVVAVGVEEWLAAFDPDDSLSTSHQTALEREVVARTSTASWPTWVGLWVDLGEVTDGVATFDGAIADVDGDALDVPVTATLTSTDDGRVRIDAEWSVTADPDADLAAADAEIYIVTDPATLRPSSASYERNDTDGLTLDEYQWVFDWTACSGAVAVSDLPSADATSTAPRAPTPRPTTVETTVDDDSSAAVTIPGFDTVSRDELPPEALDTLALIADDGPFPYRQDGAVFENREGILPGREFGYYLEYTVETPGSDDRGARRIVVGEGGEVFYTDDHYDSFQVVI